ncbi:MAG: PqqD family protein [Anaerolineae bacterium]|nr:PqqD family protein [Anaerolineae bacterium]
MQNTMLPNYSLRDGFVLFDGNNHRYYNADALAALVWNLIQQPRTLGEIRDAIVEHFGLDAEVAENDALHLLRQLEDEGLIEADSSR